MRLTTARYYTPSGRSIQALGISPDIVVQQPEVKPVDPNAPAEEKSAAMKERSEADLRGAITNDSMTDEEKRLYLEEQQHAEESATLDVLSQGNFILALFKDPETTRAAFTALRDKGLLVREMHSYGIASGLRITIGLEPISVTTGK